MWIDYEKEVGDVWALVASLVICEVSLVGHPAEREGLQLRLAFVFAYIDIGPCVGED